jgi:hypothetical protein
MGERCKVQGEGCRAYPVVEVSEHVEEVETTGLG